LTNLEKQDAQQTDTITKTTATIADLNKQLKTLSSTDVTKKDDLNKQLTAANATLTAAQTKHQDLTNQMNVLNQTTIPLEKQGFTQSQIGNESATWLQDDELIREWLTTQSNALQAKINPSASQINRDVKSLQTNMPTSNGYNTVLSSMGISNDQVSAMVTIIDRRNNAQNYFSSSLKSPAYQVLARQIVVPTQQSANQILQKLQKGSDFAALVGPNSKDANTNTKGGDLGWLARYEYIDASASSINGPEVVDNWIFDPSRKLNEVSPVLFGNGSYYIVQIMNIDPARTLDATALKALQSNALVDWLLGRRVLPGQNIIAADQTMMFDTNNLPQNNLLPQAAPSTPVAGSTTGQ
jgi:parvulin-like peptidyl-prolyl isomerase